MALIEFFVSCFAGLTYEIGWIRKVSLAFGSTNYAVSTVVAVFFAGLVTGSCGMGHWERRIASPLVLEVVSEIVLAGSAAVSPMAFQWADALCGWDCRTRSWLLVSRFQVLRRVVRGDGAAAAHVEETVRPPAGGGVC